MLASTLTIIIIRFFAISWLISGLTLVPQIIYFASPDPLPNRPVILFVPIIIYVLAAVVSWYLAPSIGKFMIKGYDAEATVLTKSLDELYALAFVFIGLYYVLSSIAPALVWIQYVLWTSSMRLPQETQNKSLYSLAQPLITLIAGVVCMLPAKRWARLLLQMQSRETE